ncbi:hypothetical protein K438DRAFT_1981629 [Mycena galopus ATCC 62051]|nr:hypothetical protein K438DRAFT_1981629 [Mycena galopus ATCC 62051]
MTEAPFDKSEWIGKGKAMVDAPPIIHQLAKLEFTMPQSFELALMPSEFLPVAKMLEFTVPLESPAKGAWQPAQYFSTNAPDTFDGNTVSRLRRLPIPELKVIKKPLAYGEQARLDGTRFLEGHLGLQARYQGAVERAALVEEAQLIVAMMPWGRGKPQGLSDAELLHTMWRFLGPHWLSGSQLNDMLELIYRKVCGDPTLSQKTHVQGLGLVPRILEAHGAGTETYKSNHRFNWLRHVCDDLVRSRAALMTAGHLGEMKNEHDPHWIALVLDLSHPTGKILYGDALEGSAPIPTSLHAACRWGISQHTDAQLLLENFPMGIQQDGFSCGMLVGNGLEHFVDPEIALPKPANVGTEGATKNFLIRTHFGI